MNRSRWWEYLWGLLFGLAVAVTAVIAGLALSAGEAERVESEKASVISGAEAARDVLTECERGHGPCEAALRQANDRLRPMGLLIFEDGSVVRER